MVVRAYVAAAVAAVLVSGCGTDEPGGAIDAASDPSADATATTDAVVAPHEVVRFVMMADTGTGGARQYAVAAAIRTLCAAEGCDFVILGGDNLYPDGADSVADPIWQAKFELPYAGIALPFHAILGNHDFGIHGNAWARDVAQLDYGAVSSRWHMPARHYTLRRGPVGFLMLDTNRLLWNVVAEGDQRAWWPAAHAELATAPWLVAVGHHPYRSNGIHGNAGTYGGSDSQLVENPGGDLKRFFDDLVCGQVDVYVAGHDHDREWLDAPAACGGTELIVTGAGGTVAPFQRAETPVWWQNDQTSGFLYVVADETTWRGRFVDADGTTAFERILTK